MSNINQLIEVINRVIESIQNRKDYQKIKFKDLNDSTLVISAPEVVDLLNHLKQSSLASLTTQEDISRDVLDKVIKTINIVIQSNESMIHKGQLDTNRTIEPVSAVEENKALQKLIAIIKMH